MDTVEIKSNERGQVAFLSMLGTASRLFGIKFTPEFVAAMEKEMDHIDESAQGMSYAPGSYTKTVATMVADVTTTWFATHKGPEYTEKNWKEIVRGIGSLLTNIH